MAQAPNSPDGRLSVFISYSRDDLDFADQLEATLSLAGFATTLDRQGIHGGEAWQAKLGSLIRDAEAIVFVLSPSSAASKICAWEVDEAVRLGKRIIPVVCRSIDGVEPPQPLRVLDYIYFYRNPKKPESGFRTGIRELVAALNDIPDWLREHTRLLRLASDWEAAGRVANRLLSGADVGRAKEWIANRPTGLPQPAELQLDFIRASDEMETTRQSAEHQRLKEMEAAQNAREAAIREKEAVQVERDAAARRVVRRTYQWLATTAAAALILAGVAYYAINQRQIALSLRDAALLQQSQFLAARATAAVERDQDASTGMLLALEALPDNESDGIVENARKLWPPASVALDAARREQRELAVLAGHTSAITKVAITADGSRIATASSDKSLRIWDAATGKPIGRPITGHSREIAELALTPDGTRAVTSSPDRTIRVWDLVKTEPLGLPIIVPSQDDEASANAQIRFLAVTPDSSRILAIYDDNTLRTWDIATGKPAAAPIQNLGSLSSMALSGDGSRIVIGTFDNAARIVDLASGKDLAQLRGHTNWVPTVAFAAAADLVVTASYDRTVRVWEPRPGTEPGTTTWQTTTTIKGFTQGVTVLAVSRDGSRIATWGSEGGTSDNAVRIWDGRTGTELAQLKGHSGYVSSLAMTPDGSRVITGSADNTARLWDSRTGQELGHLKGHTGQIYTVAFTSDGERVITGSWSGGAGDTTARVWDVRTGAQLTEFRGHASDLNSVVAMPDGTRIISGSDDGTARIWDAKTATEVARLTGHTSFVMSIAVTRDGSRIVTGSIDRSVRIWDAKTGKELSLLRTEGNRVGSVAVSPDGNFIVAAADNSVLVWQLVAGDGAGGRAWQLVRKHDDHTGTVSSVVVTADGSRVVSGAWDGMVRIWELQTGKPWGSPLKTHAQGVSSLAVTPDGSRIVTGSQDKTARIWDARTGVELVQLRGHSAAVQSVAISPDGSRVATGSLDMTARVWRILPSGPALIADARRSVPRCLSPVERRDHYLEPTPPRWCSAMEKWPYDSVGGAVEGTRLLGEGASEEAEVVFSILLRRGPDMEGAVKTARAAGHIRRGGMLLTNDRDELAKHQFDLALKHDPSAAKEVDSSIATASIERGNRALRDDKLDAAKVQFEIAMRRDPQTAGQIGEILGRYHFDRAERDLREKQDEQVGSHFELALKNNPRLATRIKRTWSDYHIRRGEDLLRDEGKEEEAKEQFALALKRDPDARPRISRSWADYYLEIGARLLDDGKEDEAKAQLERALEHDPDAAARVNVIRADSYISRGRRLYDESKDEEAKAQFDLALTHDPTASARIDVAKADSHQSRGRKLLAGDKDQEARAQFDLSLKLNPTDNRRASIHNSIAWRWFERGKPAEGLDDAQKAVALMPRDGNILDTRGQIFLALERFDAALADFDAAIREGMRDIGTYYGRGVCHEKRGNVELAKADYRRARETRPDDDFTRAAYAKAGERLRALGEEPGEAADPPR